MTSVANSGLQRLGVTRSRRALDHLLQTPDTFVWAPLPGMQGAVACVHASPHLGAGFAQYSIQFDSGGTWRSDAAHSRFVYVLEGVVRCDAGQGVTLTSGGFCFVPQAQGLSVSADAAARIVLIEKPYQPLDGARLPRSIQGEEASVLSAPLLGDEAVQVRSLMPAELSYDFAVNTMTYQPGARLSMVEVHVMEHGLLMLEGEGIYRLGDHWYPVAAGDFIWMAPYCPQWFGALGSRPAKYLIYKDWNRSPLTAASELTKHADA